MKTVVTSGVLAVLLICLPMLASAEQQHRSVSLDQKAMLGTQQLKPGHYTVKWDDSKDTTNVNFERNGKSVATATAKIVRKTDPNNAAYEFNTASGKNQLDRIYTPHEELVFGNASASNSNSTARTSTPPTQ